MGILIGVVDQCLVDVVPGRQFSQEAQAEHFVERSEVGGDVAD
jgi:hypothetical protein